MRLNHFLSAAFAASQLACLLATPQVQAAEAEAEQRISARQGQTSLVNSIVTTTELPLPPGLQYFSNTRDARGVDTVVQVDSILFQGGAGLFSGVIGVNQVGGNAQCGNNCIVPAQSLLTNAQTTWQGEITNASADTRHYYFRFDERLSLELHNYAGSSVNARAETTFIAGDISTGIVAINSGSLSAFAQPGNVGYAFGGRLNGSVERCAGDDTGPNGYTSGLQALSCGSLGPSWHEVLVDLGELDPGESLPVFLLAFMQGSIRATDVDVGALAREDAARAGPGLYEGYTFGALDLRDIGWYSIGQGGDIEAVAAGLPPPRAQGVALPATPWLAGLGLLAGLLPGIRKRR